MKVKPIWTALAGAGFILAVALGLAIARAEGMIDEETVERSTGVLLGLMLVVVGNSLPKRLESPAKENCDLSRTQSIQRFAGWTFVLAGLASATIWLTVPMAYAATGSRIAIGAAVLLVVPRWLWCGFKRLRAAPRAKAEP